MQKCTATLRFPKLEALMSVHQGLSAFVIHIKDHDSVDIYKNGFVRYYYFFIPMNLISQNIDCTISDFKRTFPFDDEAIVASWIWI